MAGWLDEMLSALAQGGPGSAQMQDFADLDQVTAPVVDAGAEGLKDAGKAVVSATLGLPGDIADLALRAHAGARGGSGIETGAGTRAIGEALGANIDSEAFQVGEFFGLDPFSKFSAAAGLAVPAMRKGSDLVSSLKPQDFERVSTRFPTAVKATEDPLAEVLETSPALMAPGNLEKATDVFRGYEQYGPLSADPLEAMGQVTDLHKQNLNFILDRMPAEMRDRSKGWYEGANRIVQDRANLFGQSPETVSGVYAALSPQTKWDLNVARGDRVLEIMGNPGQAFTPEMGEKLAFIRSKTQPKLRPLVDRIAGKKLSDLENPVEKAIWIRLYDQTHLPREYNLVTPEGDFGEIAKTASGATSVMNWGSFPEIAKAVSMIDNPQMSNISRELGEAHKIRNFYNNMAAPGDRLSTTMDTHAVAANMMQPFGGSSIPVSHNFGSTSGGIPGPSSSTAISTNAPRRPTGPRRPAAAASKPPFRLASSRS